MSLCDLDLTKAVSTLTDKLEAKYLLPVLRQKNDALSELSQQSESQEPEAELPESQMSHASSQTDTVTQTLDEPSEAPNESESDNESESILSGPSIGPRVRRARQTTVRASVPSVGFDHTAAFRRLEDVNLIKFIDYLRWSPSLIHSIEGGHQETVKNHLLLMKNNASKFDKNFLFQQRLQIGNQIENYANAVEKNAFDAIKDITIPGLSVRNLRDSIRIRWNTHKIPILEQIQMPWREGNFISFHFISFHFISFHFISFSSLPMFWFNLFFFFLFLIPQLQNAFQTLCVTWKLSLADIDIDCPHVLSVHRSIGTVFA